MPVATGYIRLNYSSTYKDFKVLAIKGQDDPDWFEMFPAIINSYIDGNKETQFKSFRRKVRVDLGIVVDRNDRLAILYWFLDNNRTIDYGSESALLFVPQQTEFENIWEEDFIGSRHFILELDESVVRVTFP
jgi:hypothetical protein